ncbi:hypothetical protein DL766_000069 [Monosporascus sp. MC13-8B]|uniref:GDP/GTP exchange factor Sec2 N-terminal domain-containing protein n=1 Tax=Monosporascus cannonballus TaxID=155416 RepID=A0ABY0GVH7_9PEZI|nr:hypothetical protein DL762_009016 [Monosporascus cannonballus]RYO83330.1 hypothetical protein DL763_007927 [Monosporascus cannonballus]RYP40045.1 hypothetical protein DL766_000069 [Monosporascus sp. MC13-8B]
MSATTKKPPHSAAVNGRLSSPNLTDNHPSTPRLQRSNTSTSPAPVNLGTTPTRRASLRGGSAMSARAAATHRASSSLSHSSDVDSDARAEAVALIDDLKERLAKADTAAEQYRKQTEVLQSRLDETLKEQAKLEERVHESEEQIEALQNEKREAARQMREMETIYEAERSSMLKEKEEMSNREEEMQAVINRLKDTLNQRNADEENRPTRQSTASPSVESGNFAPPSSIQRSDSRNSSKLLLQKDKLIESLRLELAEAQIKLVESENQGGGRLHEVERLLMEARMANARLMEDNESYQLLLQEKTLHGDFGKGDFSYMGVSANQDALNALEGRSNSGRPSSVSAEATTATSLADELGSVGDDSAETEEHIRRLEAELRAAKDQNKALTLYINKIIERLLQHQEFEHILDTSSDAKPSGDVHKEPPAPPPESQGNGGFLQRAKSMAIGGNRPKPRPISMAKAAQPVEPQQPSAHSNPETAPRIPIMLGRSQSTARRFPGRPMSEQFVGAAGVVNAMYKGPDGPLSPTFSNSRHSQSFFSASSGMSTPRIGSGATGNFPGSMRSETSSVSGDSASGAGDGTTTAASSTAASITQSPPRGGEKHATFTGNKPRPLRLVQETAEAKEKENQSSKRSSWIGWAPWAKKDDAPHAPSESIRE